METSKQEHGQMINEIIETFGYPDMTRVNGKFVNLSIDVNSVVGKYLSRGINEDDIDFILNKQGFTEKWIESKNNHSKVTAQYYIKSGKEHLFEIPHYRIGIIIKFENHKSISVSGSYRRLLNSL